MKDDETLNLELHRLIYGFRASQCLYAAASLGIADRIADASCSSAEIVQFTQAHPPSIQRLLLALTNMGVLAEDENGSYFLTPMGKLLRSDSKGSRKAEILHMLQPSSWAPWGHLLSSVRSGRPAFPETFGTDVWTYRAQHPATAALFQDMAAAMSLRESGAILKYLDLANAKRVADIGGGRGIFITEILKMYREISGVLFDLPGATSDAMFVLETGGVKDRCTILSGNFFDQVPEGCDVYLLKSVIHNWPDEPAVSILKNCKLAMSRTARIILIETLCDPKAQLADTFQDLHMLVIHGGKQRTAHEYGLLLEAAGFRIRRVVPTDADISLIEGIPA